VRQVKHQVSGLKELHAAVKLWGAPQGLRPYEYEAGKSVLHQRLREYSLHPLACRVKGQQALAVVERVVPAAVGQVVCLTNPQ
jgi:hypothetical protein